MLYIVNKKAEALTNCVARASANDAILLIENAVFAALAIEQNSVLAAVGDDVAVYALMPDILARGITVERCYEHIQYLDYAGFVALVEQHNPIRSCF